METTESLRRELKDLQGEVARMNREKQKKEVENLQLRTKINEYESGIDGMKKAQMEITYLREQLKLRSADLQNYKELYVKCMNDNQILADTIRVCLLSNCINMISYCYRN
jgi:predicted nuclease with TOPRIM domain